MKGNKLIAEHPLFSIIKLLEKNKGERKGKYILAVEHYGELLLLNSLSLGLVFLEGFQEKDWQDEQLSEEQRKFLTENYFLVSKDFDEKKIYNQLFDICKVKQKNKESYVIFTTNLCNARCYYCFEKEMPKFPMSENTALDTVKFIQNTSKGEKISLHWFGGEPLVNVKIIDLISSELRKLEIEFKSDMISNGYLFDEETVRRAVDLWNLKKVQITLDGTEDVYNQTKAYVSANESAYKRVIKNIGLLSEAGIKVNIRLNLSFDNSENLLLLADELSSLFAGNENISVYVMPLYEYFKTDDSTTINFVFDAYITLVNKLIELGLYKANKLPESLPLNHCMADSDNAYGILPNGNICKCRDERAMETVGDIWNGITDKEKVEWFKQRVPVEEKCKTCVFAPSCTLLNACSVKCNELYRLKKRFDLEQSMLAAYRKWKEENKEKEYETQE